MTENENKKEEKRASWWQRRMQKLEMYKAKKQAKTDTAQAKVDVAKQKPRPLKDLLLALSKAAMWIAILIAVWKVATWI